MWPPRQLPRAPRLHVRSAIPLIDMAFSHLMTRHSHPCPHASRSPHLAISPNPLHPHVVAAHHLTRWLTPFGISHVNILSAFFPAHVIAMSFTLLSKSLPPTTLTNYLSAEHSNDMSREES